MDWEDKFLDPLQRLMLNTETDLDSGCWDCFLRTDRKGYPVIQAGVPGEKKPMQARRFAYESTNDTEIPKGHILTSTCGNKICVNPDHMILKVREGGNRKLTDEQIANIKIDTRKQRIIAEEYGVSRSLIGQIQCGARWLHVDAAIQEPKSNVVEFKRKVG